MSYVSSAVSALNLQVPHKARGSTMVRGEMAGVREKGWCLVTKPAKSKFSDDERSGSCSTFPFSIFLSSSKSNAIMSGIMHPAGLAKDQQGY